MVKGEFPSDSEDEKYFSEGEGDGEDENLAELTNGDGSRKRRRRPVAVS